MKHIMTVLTALLLSGAAQAVFAAAPKAYEPAASDPMSKVINKMLMDKLDAQAGIYKEKWDYWNGIKKDILSGDVDALVNKAVDEAVSRTKEAIKDAKNKATNWEIAWMLFEKLAPEALGPIGVLKGTSEFVHDGTQAWLDWAAAKHKERFYEAVLDPEKSPDVEKLDANWNDYKEWVLNTTANDKGLQYDKREAFEKDLEAAYKKRRAEIEEAERRRNSAQSVAELKAKLTKRLNWMRMETEMEVKSAVELLKTAKLPQTEANILRYINDVNFHNELVKTWWKAVEDHQAAIDAATPMGKAAVMVEKTADARPTPTPDYSEVTREYGLNSDRLVTNNITAAEFSAVRDGLWKAVQNINSSCIESCRSLAENSDERKACFSACEAAYGVYRQETDKVDKNREDLLVSLRTELEAPAKNRDLDPLGDYYVKLAADYNALPAVREKDGADGLLQSCAWGNSETCMGNWRVNWEYYWSGITGTPPRRLIKLEEMEQNRDRLAHTAAVYAALSGEAARRSRDFQDRTTAYEKEFIAGITRYTELYQKNSSMADLMGIERYDFSYQAGRIEEAKKRFGNAGDFVSPLYASRLYTGRQAALKEQKVWDDEIAANEKALEDSKDAPAQLAGLTSWTYKGRKEELSQNFLESYYDANYKDFLMNFLQGALVLLDPKTRGALVNPQTPEYARFGNGSKPVREISATASYASLQEHRKKLAEFGAKLDELKELGLEKRRETADALFSRTSAAAAKRAVPCAELVGIVREALAIRGKMGRLTDGGLYDAYLGERTLNYAALEGAYKDYSARIQGADEYEKSAVEACLKAQADPKFDYRDYTTMLIGAGKWKPSRETEETCGTANRKKYEGEEKAFRKYMPFKEVTLAGRPLPQGGGLLEAKAGDFPGGKAVIRGALNPETADYRTVYVTTDGSFEGRYKDRSAEIVNGTFEYSLPVTPGETYYLKVQATGPDGLISIAFPSGNGGLTLKVLEEDKTAEIQAFYEKFRSAYEGRNAPGVMALISPDWGAGSDETGVADLDENLRTNFRLYDEIRFALSGLKVTGQKGAYQACYDTVITSRIYKRNLKHEERSAVCDELKAGGDGRLRIARTLSGRYWYVK